jgi:hypothetical protein
VADVGDAEAQISVGATVGLSSQSSGASDQPYLGPGFGGTSFSIVIFVDGPDSSKVTVGGEMSLAADLSGSQSQPRLESGPSAAVVFSLLKRLPLSTCRTLSLR